MSAPARSPRRPFDRIESGKYDVIILNFANCDMVGHTGVFDAAVARPWRPWTRAWPRSWKPPLDLGGVALITADHGNAEQMLDDRRPALHRPYHEPRPLLHRAGPAVRLRDGRLADIAPTMLDLMGLNQPQEMDGKTLILNT